MLVRRSIGCATLLAITGLVASAGAKEHNSASKPIIKKKSLREKKQQQRKLGYGIPKEYVDKEYADDWGGDAHEYNYYSSSRDAWGPSFKCVSKADKASLPCILYLCVRLTPIVLCR